MRKLNLFLTILTAMGHSSAIAATLVYVDMAGQATQAIGGDPNADDPERFTAYRCRLKQGAYFFSPENKSMADFRRDPQADCAPVNQVPLRYERMPGSVAQAKVELEQFLERNKLADFANTIEEARRLGKLKAWDIDPAFDSVYVRLGNTIFHFVLNRFYPVEPQVKGAFDWLGSDATEQLGNNLPQTLRSAQESPGVFFTRFPQEFLQNAERLMLFVAMADSQRGNGEECRDLIEQLSQVYFRNEDLVALASQEADRAADIFRAGRPLAEAIAAIRGNLDPNSQSQGWTDERCAQALRTLARELPDMTENIRSLMLQLDLGSGYEKLMESSAPFRTRISDRANEVLVDGWDAR